MNAVVLKRRYASWLREWKSCREGEGAHEAGDGKDHGGVAEVELGKSALIAKKNVLTRPVNAAAARSCLALAHASPKTVSGAS